MKLIKKFFACMLILLCLSTISISTVLADEENNLDIKSKAALLMDLKSGKVLYQKNIDEKLYPASLTKVMTAIIVLENCNLSDVVTVSSNAVNSISFGYVTANLKVDEQLTVEQLLYVLMVGSSNDAAVVLAEHVSGSVENFSVLMNEKAKEIGCTSTNFVNPNGEHDENHYSTAHDLALIARYAMQNETFRTLVSTTFYRLPATNKYNKDDRFFSTTNDLLNKNSNYYYKYAIGVKTGFTTPAGNCLISCANKDDLELLTVVLGAEESKQRYLDTRALFDYGYETYSMKEIVKSGEVVHTVNISNATNATKNLDLAVSDDIYSLVKQENESLPVFPEISLNENLKAPIKKGDIVGSAKYTIEGITYETSVFANSDVKVSFLFIYILIFVVVLFGIIFLLSKRNKRKK